MRSWTQKSRSYGKCMSRSSGGFSLPVRIYRATFLEYCSDLDHFRRHSHEFEVKSGMLVLPKPSAVSAEEWEAAELKAMHEVVGLYGKTWHFWQVDKGDELPLGAFVNY